MIIGGTSGMGLALTKYYLAQGNEVAVCGRDLGVLKNDTIDVCARCEKFEFDIGDYSATQLAIEIYASKSIDIVTAGLYADSAALSQRPELAFDMIRTNIDGLNQVLGVAAGIMRKQGHGQLVAFASIAGLIADYPGVSLYSICKRSVIELCGVYRKALAAYGIAITVIIPGYVDTQALRSLNNGDATAKPFLVSEQDAVNKIVAAIDGRRERLVFPWPMHALVSVFNCLPNWVKKRIRK